MASNLLQPIRGTKDIMGEDIKLLNFISETARATAFAYGYQEIQTPIFENSDIFFRSLGDTSDIVSKETYTFLDRDKTSITLRPEFTAGVVRAFISNGLTQSLPLKLFSSGPVFRHERPQKCRYRQFYQINCEYLGAKTPHSDIETIALAHQILTNLGFGEEITLEINTLGDSGSRIQYKTALLSYLKKYQSELSEDSQRRLEKNPLRILDSKDDQDKKIVANAPNLLDYLNKESKDYFLKVLEGLNNLKINYLQNPKLVRGLDYYTHTAFEFTTNQLGSQGTVLGGGRYDSLVELMGGPLTPAIGFAAGIERLAELLKLKGRTPIEENNFYFITIGEEVENSAYIILNTLRKSGLKIITDYGSNVSKMFKKANAQNSMAAILFGEEEMRNNEAKVKNMTTGVEEKIAIDKLVEYLKKFKG